MTTTTSTAPDARNTDRHKLVGSWVYVLHAVLAVLVFAYLMSLVLRTSEQYSIPLDGWVADGLEFLAGLLCLSRGILHRPGRAVPLLLGGALLSWAAGDLVLTIESLGGATPTVPSPADSFFLGFYALAYVALVLYLRREVRQLTPPSWLDGGVAGLGAAAVCSTFAFDSIVRTAGGSSAQVLTNLIFPVGDLLLLALVVASAAFLSGRSRTQWILLSSACLLNAAGDTANLFSVTASHWAVAFVLNSIAWPAASLLVSLAMWLPLRPAGLQSSERAPGFVLPGLSAVAALVILVTGTLRTTSRLSVGLATATLAVVVVRLGMSVRSLGQVTRHRHQQSVTDELTSLGNRRYLFDVLETLFADTGQPTSQHLAFLFVDLDRFKEVNDSFGHPAGDALLRQLGPRLRRVLRDSDVVVRLGGDEFAIVLLDGGAEYAVDVALRVAASIEERFVLEHMSARISASIGIALAPDHANDAAGLLRCADVAMYRAKLSGRTVAVFDHDLDDGGNLLELADELREAVADDSFVLHFQPQLDLRTRDVCGYEALVRWRHPRLGLLPPSKFLALAEEAGLMPSLTSWVLDEALAQAAAWMADGRPSAVSVNVSATNLLDVNFSGLVRELLRQHRVPATELVLEITETCIISDYGRSRAVIEELSDLGVIMSIDDFGAGFTALAYLADLAVGELKLDRTFISGLAAGGRDRDLVRSTIGLGHALGLRVVAEGAEDSATLELLAELGCDRAQGYIIGRPHPSRTVHSCRAASISPSSAVGRL